MGIRKKYGVELNAYTNEYMTGYHEVGHKNQLHTMLDDDFARFQSKEVPDAAQNRDAGRFKRGRPWK